METAKTGEELKQENRRRVLALLEERGIPYTLEEHPAAHTIQEMMELGLSHPEWVCKNLFLRDAKGKRHFLVVLEKDKRADLRLLADRLGSGKLSFASEERLMRLLGLERGAVTPLGILNDAEHAVEMVFDRDLMNHSRLGVHPCVNTATVWLAPADLRRMVEENGNPISTIEI